MDRNRDIGRMRREEGSFSMTDRGTCPGYGQSLCAAAADAVECTDEWIPTTRGSLLLPELASL